MLDLWKNIWYNKKQSVKGSQRLGGVYSNSKEHKCLSVYLFGGMTNMEAANFSTKEIELAQRILKLAANFCAQFWAEKLTNSAEFWSCKANKSTTKIEQEFLKKNVPYDEISSQQIVRFIKVYEKMAAGEIAMAAKNGSEIAIILGYSDSTFEPGFASGIKENGEPKFFLGNVMKDSKISGVFLNMDNNYIAIKGGKLFLMHNGVQQVLLTI